MSDLYQNKRTYVMSISNRQEDLEVTFVSDTHVLTGIPIKANEVKGFIVTKIVSLEEPDKVFGDVNHTDFQGLLFSTNIKCFPFRNGRQVKGWKVSTRIHNSSLKYVIESMKFIDRIKPYLSDDDRFDYKENLFGWYLYGREVDVNVLIRDYGYCGIIEPDHIMLQQLFTDL